MSRPALFLDRDGVINIDHGYVYRPEDFEFIDGIFELVFAANQAGFLVIVITNQAGIGRGYYTEADFWHVSNWMRNQFAMRGSRIDDVYFCPFHPEYGVGEYCRESDFRKPGPGMLLQARKDHDLDLEHSVFVGDKPSDMEAGKRAGVGTLIYLSDGATVLGATRIACLSEVLPYLLPGR